MSPQQAQIMKVVPWVLGPISFFVTWKMVASVQLFFATTALLQYVQTTLWHLPAVRRACGLPSLEEVSQLSRNAPSPFAAAGPGAGGSSSSPFAKAGAAKGGIQYQAPRTVSTTATEGAAQKPDSSNPWEAAKDSWASLKEKMDKRAAGNSIKNEKSEAAKYEKKRLQEEHEQYLKRREAAAKNSQRK